MRGFLFSIILIYIIPFCALAQKHYKDLTYPEIQKVEIPKATTITLDNGIKVILIEDHELPFISMRAEFFAGSYWGDPDDKVGLAQLTGQIMRTGGSINMPGDRVDEELEAIAASVETWIDEVYGGAQVSTLKDHFNNVSKIFADILMHPAFPEDKIDLAKVQAKSNISRRNDNVNQIATREFNQLIYKNSNLSRDQEYRTIDTITRDDLIAFHKKWVRPNGMALGVWGDFKTKKMAQKIKKLFAAWKPVEIENVQKWIEIPYEYKYTVNLIKKSDVNQSNITIGFSLFPFP